MCIYIYIYTYGQKVGREVRGCWTLKSWLTSSLEPFGTEQSGQISPKLSPFSAGKGERERDEGRRARSPTSWYGRWVSSV